MVPFLIFIAIMLAACHVIFSPKTDTGWKRLFFAALVIVIPGLGYLLFSIYYFSSLGDYFADIRNTMSLALKQLGSIFDEE